MIIKFCVALSEGSPIFKSNNQLNKGACRWIV